MSQPPDLEIIVPGARSTRREDDDRCQDASAHPRTFDSGATSFNFRAASTNPRDLRTARTTN
jgi:hypothetical protein